MSGERAGGEGANRGRRLVIGSLAAATLLVLVYLLAGGSSYSPAQTQDPCKPRTWRDPQGLQQIAEQFSLSALDGAACKLGVTRETLARALATEASRQRFLKRYDIDDAELARAIRAGLLRAIDDAEEAGALSPFLATPLRSVVKSIPLDEAIELVQDGRSLIESARSFIGPAEELLEQFLP